MDIERIYIPTVRRANIQLTFEALPDELKKKVIMVVEPEEKELYTYDCDYLVIPESIVGTWTQLAETRLLIHKHAGPIKYCVADDDITIRRRNAKYWTGNSNMESSSRNATPDEILEAFTTMSAWLDEKDIGIAGFSNSEAPPPNAEYVDTKGVFSMIFVDGRMLSKVLDHMDLTAIRVAEDVLFMYECLSRGINTRMATEWMLENNSVKLKELKNTRLVWMGMYGQEQPKDHFQTDEHYAALSYIQNKWPHAMKIYEKDGRRKNTKYWKKAYKPLEKLTPKQLRGADENMAIRDRIKGLQRVKARELHNHPGNWRKHPQQQQNAMQAILEDIGYATALVAYETAQGLVLIDGHLRAGLDPDQLVPVLVLDLNDEEALKVLATLDPLSSMAETDTAALEDILESIQFSDHALNAMLDSLLDVQSVTDPFEEWNGMPEFVSESQDSYKILKVHFDSDEDIAAFAELVGQNVGFKTQYIWFPKQQKIDAVGTQRYSSES